MFPFSNIICHLFPHRRLVWSIARGRFGEVNQREAWARGQGRGAFLQSLYVCPSEILRKHYEIAKYLRSGKGGLSSTIGAELEEFEVASFVENGLRDGLPRLFLFRRFFLILLLLELSLSELGELEDDEERWRFFFFFSPLLLLRSFSSSSLNLGLLLSASLSKV